MFFLSPAHGFGETLRRLCVQGVPVFVGAILLTAAALKTHQLAAGPTTEDSFFTSRWFLIALVEFEMALGLWLWSGVYPKQARLMVLAAFTGFGLMSLYRALMGASSCGCFGMLHVNPWSTLLFDLLVAAALWRWTPSISYEHIYIYRGGAERSFTFFPHPSHWTSLLAGGYSHGDCHE